MGNPKENIKQEIYKIQNIIATSEWFGYDFDSQKDFFDVALKIRSNMILNHYGNEINISIGDIAYTVMDNF